MQMTKSEFLSHVAALYRVGNMSDSDNPERPDWVKPEMAGAATCQPLDDLMAGLVSAAVLTSEEAQAFYDTI